MSKQSMIVIVLALLSILSIGASQQPEKQLSENQKASREAESKRRALFESNKSLKDELVVQSSRDRALATSGLDSSKTSGDISTRAGIRTKGDTSAVAIERATIKTANYKITQVSKVPDIEYLKETPKTVVKPANIGNRAVIESKEPIKIYDYNRPVDIPDLPKNEDE